MLIGFPLMAASCRQPVAETIISRPPAASVQFRDVSAQAGIDFQHRNGACGGVFMPETFSAGGAWLDYDNDGFLDILLLNGRPLCPGGDDRGVPPPEGGGELPQPALYRNDGDGTFTNATPGSGLDVSLYSMGCAVGDYDNDGWQDIFISTVLEPNALFRNQGDGTFREVGRQAGVDNPRWGSSCAWLDYDNDGWLDLFVCGYVQYLTLADDRWCSLRPGIKSYCTPETYDGEPCFLYRNNGDGTFADITAESGLGASIGKALGAALLDYDVDGWLDVAVANDERPNFLFHNIPAPAGSPLTRAYEEVALFAGIALDEHGLPKAGMGIDACDYLNDGRLGILIGNFSNEGLSLFVQERPGGDLFLERAFHAGLGEPSLLKLTFGTLFFDVDHDGWQDAAIANGHVQDDINLLQSTVFYAQTNQLFRNQGDGSFADVSAQSGAPFSYERVTRGIIGGDYDNDGDPDLLVINNNGPAELLRNDGGNRRNWIQIKVRGRGPGQGGSNLDAIGAWARVTTGDTVQQRWVRTGSGYLSQNMLRLHWGLGNHQQVDRIQVRFPSGKVVERRDVAANQILLLEEGS